jgi:hypothetical protein
VQKVRAGALRNVEGRCRRELHHGTFIQNDHGGPPQQRTRGIVVLVDLGIVVSRRLVEYDAWPICCRHLTRLLLLSCTFLLLVAVSWTATSADDDAITCGSAIKIQQGETNYYLNSEEKQLGNGVRSRMDSYERTHRWMNE